MLSNIPIWWIFISAAVLSAWWVKVVLGTGINADIFTTVVQKILREKNVVRCLKLTAAAGDAPVGRATRAAILAAISREQDNNRPAGYRGNRPVSMDAVRTRIRTQYDVAFSESVDPLARAFSVALIPLILLCVGASLGALSPEPDLKLIGGACIGFLAWFYVAFQHIRILKSRNKVFEALWPNLEILYHDRHSISLENKPAYPGPEKTTDPPSQTTNSPAETTNPRLMLDILEPERPVRTMAFDQSVIKIGTLETAHLRLTGEGIARMHAVIEMTSEGATIIDLGATRQTKVNLHPIQKHKLANGEVIGIGDVDIVVRSISPTVSE
jgi:FHA domain